MNCWEVISRQLVRNQVFTQQFQDWEVHNIELFRDFKCLGSVVRIG